MAEQSTRLLYNTVVVYSPDRLYTTQLDSIVYLHYMDKYGWVDASGQPRYEFYIISPLDRLSFLTTNVWGISVANFVRGGIPLTGNRICLYGSRNRRSVGYRKEIEVALDDKNLLKWIASVSQPPMAVISTDGTLPINTANLPKRFTIIYDDIGWNRPSYAYIAQAAMAYKEQDNLANLYKVYIGKAVYAMLSEQDLPNEEIYKRISQALEQRRIYVSRKEVAEIYEWYLLSKYS